MSSRGRRESSSSAVSASSATSSASKKKGEKGKGKGKRRGNNAAQPRYSQSSASSSSSSMVKPEEIDPDDEENRLPTDDEAEDVDEIDSAMRKDVEVSADGVIDIETMELKPDHAVRPIIVTPDRRIFLETFSPVYRQAAEFIIAIAEPERRPLHVHEYKLTRDSLYAAASLGLKAEKIINILDRFCKTALPWQVVEHIRKYTERYGKVTLYMEKNKYYLESADPKALHAILNDDFVQSFRVHAGKEEEEERQKAEAEARKKRRMQDPFAAVSGINTAGDDITDEEALAATEDAEMREQLPADLREILDRVEEDNELEKEQDLNRISFQIKRDGVEKIQQHQLSTYPLLMEYDYINDPALDSIRIDLKPTCRLRPYQEKSLKKMFTLGRARSGIIVLPCGAGKTLTGVAAASTIKKSVIVLCTSAVAVRQWQREFIRWCNVDKSIVKGFTAKEKPMLDKHCILCTTYPMLATSKERTPETQRVINAIMGKDWGLMILDEVQVAPARKYRQLLTKIPARCKLGLTATLVREDNKIGDLRFMVGPKLYEANWTDLADCGYIARVKCLEVWCPMLPKFYREYCKITAHSTRMLLCVFNPAKMMACEFLIRMHEARGDKILVMGEKVEPLEELAATLKNPGQWSKNLIRGKTSDADREEILEQYKLRSDFNTIFLSKVGDNSIDLPEANVLIQIESSSGGRRQEAQRLGRILRAKSNDRTKPGDPNAFFYSLVSQDTKEMSYATARQRFLVDQGYSFQVLKTLKGFKEEGQREPYKFGSVGKQNELLTRIIASSSAAQHIGGPELKRAKMASAQKASSRLSGLQLTSGSMSTLAGAHNMIYKEHRASSQIKSLFRRKKK